MRGCGSKPPRRSPPAGVGSSTPASPCRGTPGFPVLAFLDADVRLEPDALARMVSFLHTTNAGLVSGFPRQETGTLFERLVIPLINWLLVCYFPMIGMRHTRRAMFGVGCGQWFTTTREAYDAVGGHAAVKASLHDGITLPRVYRRAGFHTDICDATMFATCRMYRSARGVWDGLAKNAREGMAATAQLPVWTFVLLAGQVVPFALLLSAASSLPVLGAVALAWVPRFHAAWRFRASWVGAVLHPVGVSILLAIQWYAVYRSAIGRPVGWKGRVHPGSK